MRKQMVTRMTVRRFRLDSLQRLRGSSLTLPVELVNRKVGNGQAPWVRSARQAIPATPPACGEGHTGWLAEEHPGRKVFGSPGF